MRFVTRRIYGVAGVWPATRWSKKYASISTDHNDESFHRSLQNTNGVRKRTLFVRSLHSDVTYMYLCCVHACELVPRTPGHLCSHDIVRVLHLQISNLRNGHIDGHFVDDSCMGCAVRGQVARTSTYPH
jgi:hypothetical protein